jgi:hypothetical protein
MGDLLSDGKTSHEEPKSPTPKAADRDKKKISDLGAAHHKHKAHHKQKSEICSIKTEHDSHTTTEVTALPPSFDYWDIKFQILAH